VETRSPLWFGASQAAICLFAGLALLSFWIGGVPEVRRAPGQPVRRDPGLFWLAAAVLAWALLGFWTWIGPQGPGVDAALAIASTVNNGFFWLAIAHLDHGPERLRFLRVPRVRWMFLAAVFGLAVAIGFWSRRTTGWVQQLPDVAFSVVTLVALGWALAVSFARRGFAMLAGLACVAVAMQIAAQWRVPDYNWVLILVSKTATITTFLALAMSWAHERARLSGLGLYFTGRLEGDRIAVEVDGERKLMTPEVHRRLLVFAAERVLNPTGGGGLVNIKEKGIAHTHIKRIVEQLGIEDRVALFDNDGRSGYRLKVPAHNIGFDLTELRNHAELQDLVDAIEPVVGLRRRGPRGPVPVRAKEAVV
jgi:hypothetical protein